MEILARSIDPRQLLVPPLVDWGRSVLDRFALERRRVQIRNLVEEKQLYNEARVGRILRKVFVGVEDYKIQTIEDRRANPSRFHGQTRWHRQIVGGRKTPDYGHYEIWSQVLIEPNASTRILIISGEDEIYLNESEWRNRKICEQALRETVKRPATMATYVLDFSAENNWNNPYWEGINVTHLLGPLK